MSLENRILEEEYILKLKELSQSRRSNYINRRYELIVRYMIDDQSGVIFKNLPVSDCYFQEMDNYDQTPFIVKTDLFTELAELDKTNHGGLIDEIESLKKEFLDKLAEEKKARVGLDEGQRMERDHEMIANFIETYGYDPTSTSIMTKNINHDGLEMDLSEDEEEKESEDENPGEEKEEEKKPKRKPRQMENAESVVTTGDPNGDLSFLNQILEITGIDFNQVNQDVIQEIPKEKPKRKTKKEKEAEGAATTTDATSDLSVPADETEDETPKKKTSKKTAEESKSNELTADEKLKALKKEIADLVTKAQVLVDVNQVKKKKTWKEDNKDSIEAANTIADLYRSGDKLHKSEAKANLINLFLVKNYEDPKSMYNIGMALAKGVSIMKNTKQGLKFIKVASDKYKYSLATTALKRMTKAKETKTTTNK